MDSPDEQHLKQTIERLTQENAKLRSQLAVAEQWNPPLDLEHAFRTAKGWQCVTVALVPEQPTLILIRGTEPGTQEDEAAAGEVWRHLQTAAPPGGGIGPFARSRMPSRLLGYLREHGGRTIIVLNRDLRRGQVSRAARILRSNARMRHPRLLELSAIPLLGLCALSHGGSAKGMVGLSAAVAPTATLVLSVAIAPSTSLYEATQPSPGQVRPTSSVTQSSNKETLQPVPRQHRAPPEKSRKTLASSETARSPGSAPEQTCASPTIPPERLPIPMPTPSTSPTIPPPLRPTGAR